MHTQIFVYSNKLVYKPSQVCKTLEQEKGTLKTKVCDTSLTAALNAKLDNQVTLNNTVI